MEAGRELDALVGEKVMGFTLDYEFEEITNAPNVKELRSKDDEWGILPNYSTDIAAAWQVVEMFRRGVAGHVAAYIEMHVSDAVRGNDCSCSISAPDLAEVVAFANEMPLAICLAALKAVGVDVESMERV